MALRWFDGFETHQGDFQMARRWGLANGAIVTGAPRVPGTGVSYRDNGGQFRNRVGDFTIENTWICQFGWYMDSFITGTAEGHVKLFDDTGEQLTLQAIEFTGDINSNRWQIQIKRGSTVLATTGPLWNKQWYYIQFKSTIHNTTGSYELKIDGVSVLTDAGPINTANQGTPGATRFDFVFGGSTTAQFDDIVLMDSTGSTFNDFVSAMIVVGMFPNGDHTTQWDTSSGVTHYVLVDDPAGAPNDTDYVESDTAADRDLWEYTDLEILDNLSSTPTIRAIEVETVAALNGSGSRTIRPVFRNGSGGGGIVTGTNVVLTGGVFAASRQLWENNPDTVAAWTIAEVEGAQFGVDLVS